MRSNLLLGLILALIGWYLFNRPTAVPLPVVEEKPTPAPRVDYSGVRTYYSPLNDPPVSASGQPYGGSAVVLGAGNNAGQRVSGGGTGNGAVVPAPTVSSINVGGAGNR